MKSIGDEAKRWMRQKDYQQQYEEMKKEIQNHPDVKAFLEEHQEQLTQADIEKSFSKIYEYVQEKEKFDHQSPTMIAPGYEPKLFLNFHSIDVTYIPTEALLAQRRQEEIRQRVQAIDMPKEIKEARFLNYEGTSGRAEALLAAVDFADSYQKNPQTFHKGLYFVGSLGIGKTYLLGAIASELAEKGFSSTMLHFPTLTVEMKRSIGDDTVGEKLDALKKAPILMLDDIGAESMSSWIRDDILGVILQHRMQEQLPTLFTSNLTMKELEIHLSTTQRGEEEPLKAKRLMERIRYLAKEVKLTGVNRRNK